MTEADQESLAVARRTWREFDEKDLERLDPRNFRHRETGELWVIPNGLVSLFDTESAEAFAIRGGYIVPLARKDADENETSVMFGAMASRQT